METRMQYKNTSAATGQKVQSIQMQEHNLNLQTIKAIETVLAKGLKAEVIPAKHGIIVKQIRQETVLEPKKEYRTGA